MKWVILHWGGRGRYFMSVNEKRFGLIARHESSNQRTGAAIVGGRGTFGCDSQRERVRFQACLPEAACDLTDFWSQVDLQLPKIKNK